MVTINLIAIGFTVMAVGQFVNAKIAADPSKARMWERVFAILSCCISIVGWVFVLTALVAGGMHVTCDAVQP